LGLSAGHIAGKMHEVAQRGHAEDIIRASAWTAALVHDPSNLSVQLS